MSISLSLCSITKTKFRYWLNTYKWTPRKFRKKYVDKDLAIVIKKNDLKQKLFHEHYCSEGHQQRERERERERERKRERERERQRDRETERQRETDRDRDRDRDRNRYLVYNKSKFILCFAWVWYAIECYWGILFLVYLGSERRPW